MKTVTDRQDAVRFWGLGTLAFLLCAGTAFSYLFCMSNGMAAGDMIGLQGREQDVITAQRWARFWFTTSVCCLGASGLAAALATPIYEEGLRAARFVGRAIIAATVSFVLAVLIGWVTVSIAMAAHHSAIS